MRNQLPKHIIRVLFTFCFFSTDVSGQTIYTDTLQNQTISNNVLVQGSNQLVVNNVTVTPAGQLKATAPSGVVLNGPFEVQLGGTLELTGWRQWPISYEYDNSGNIVVRRKN